MSSVSLNLETLERRTLLSTIPVTSTADSGPGSLRAAILAANDTEDHPGLDTIEFDFPGAGPHTITVQSELPQVTDPLVIDGTTQSGYASGAPVVELRGGGGLGSSANGLYITADNSRVSGLAIGGFSRAAIDMQADNGEVSANFIGTEIGGSSADANGIGVELTGSDFVVIDNLISGNSSEGLTISGINPGDGDHVVERNTVGLDVTGTFALPNGQFGLRAAMSVGGSGSTIIDNVVSGNDGTGIAVFGDDIEVRGNHVGVTPDGNTAVANGGHGIDIRSGSRIVIGGSAEADRNVISGNGQSGVRIIAALGQVPQNVTIVGNYIGTSADGVGALGNSDSGVFISGSPFNTIGGTVAGEENVISGNAGSGVHVSGQDATGNVIEGNLIGTDRTGTGDTGNQGHGVLIGDDASNTTIGGSAPDEGNTISGNDTDGIRIAGGASGNSILGNRIGTNSSVTAAVGNGQHGVILLDGATNTTIGGNDTADRNYISGNAGSGVHMQDSTTTGNEVLGNYIGLDQAGSTVLANDNDGVTISNSPGNTIDGEDALGNAKHGVLIQDSNNNQVGGGQKGTALTSRSNLISGNGEHGVLIFRTDNQTDPVEGNKIQNNFIGHNLDGGVLVEGGDGNSLIYNWIGTDKGLVVPPNLNNAGPGVKIVAATGTTIGGDGTQEENFIAFNDGDGVLIEGAGDGTALGTGIYNNKIGSDAGGTVMPNLGHGVRITRAGGNTVGGVLNGNNVGNVIAENNGDGISVTGTAPDNRFRFNEIRDNGGLDHLSGPERQRPAGPSRRERYHGW
jgi:parallel beta-helix repeat protein